MVIKLEQLRSSDSEDSQELLFSNTQGAAAAVDEEFCSQAGHALPELFWLWHGKAFGQEVRILGANKAVSTLAAEVFFWFGACFQSGRTVILKLPSCGQ